MEQTVQYCTTCNTLLQGEFCSKCGEKISTDKSELKFSYFIKDALEEIFSVDSKFLRTLRLLITRPGFLTMEVLAGRRVMYIKPVKLYTIIVVVHFVIFSLAGSGDLFSTDKFPVIKLIPDFPQMLLAYESASGLSHEDFKATLNGDMKDALNIIFYFLPFALAVVFKLLYAGSGKYYIEHLYVVLSLITFGLIRNIILVPLLIIDWMGAAVAIGMVTQFWYTYNSLKVVYGESPLKTTSKVVLALIGFVVILTPGWFLALAIGIARILN
jgi:hypothetical protein